VYIVCQGKNDTIYCFLFYVAIGRFIQWNSDLRLKAGITGHRAWRMAQKA